MNKRIIAAVSAIILTAVSTSVFAENTFLCMRAAENTAITIDENRNFKYIDMVASNGQHVVPQISEDGNTYLPFRYVCEMTGLKDGSQISGELQDGYFRFWNSDPSIPNDKQKIEIKYNGNYYCHNIGEPFTYETPQGDVRTVSIYNIRGSLYFPFAYMAKITDSKAIWQDDTRRIIFISNDLDVNEFLNEKNDLRRDKYLYLNFDFFCNNLGNSPLYLKTDGVTIQNLSDEIYGNPKVKSITRNGNTIYFINEDKRVYTKTENNEEINPLKFTDENEKSVDVLADTVISLQGRLYGIQINSVNDKYGKLFSANSDGSGFKYLTDKTVYNLIARKSDMNYYLFYCDALTKANLNMIELKTMDNYDIQITDHARNNLLSNIKQFVIGSNIAAYLSNDGKVHVINLHDNLEDFEVIRVSGDEHKIFLTGSDGEALTNITSMNFDYINNVLYVTQVDYTGRTYYYTLANDRFTRLERSEHSITDVSLFSDLSYNDYCAKTINGKSQINRVKYNNGSIEIAD